MLIQTKYHGELNIEEQEVLRFETGIPGFLEEKAFALLSLDENLWILQSITTPQLAFVVTNPFLFFKGYEFQLSEQVKELLNIQSEEEVSVLSILTVAEHFQNSTANLQAPIIVNMRTKDAKQVILTDTNYQTKHVLAG
ncbi:flagellar assembly protein FliW [Bacillus lacus]|uniref:Flagellar assembly factor FliW n=1 Tax=Metabacillus lacus TaxID=1983721 RepID=A0A7X2IYW7_9BACI|nr:flagellar assembly protein FliW [Metabacillus lacus]MRX72189.1 flagellar assembly protein FliW [Metabacillus lacus]